jgi:hypothetical protein
VAAEPKSNKPLTVTRWLSCAIDRDSVRPVVIVMRHVSETCPFVGIALANETCTSIKSQADTVVSCDPGHPECTITSNDDQTLFRIDKPVVDRDHFDYPSILFAPGDRIRFEADGCVQTGGIGDTWHDYVVPLDDPFIGAIHPDALQT